MFCLEKIKNTRFCRMEKKITNILKPECKTGLVRPWKTCGGWGPKFLDMPLSVLARVLRTYNGRNETHDG